VSLGAKVTVSLPFGIEAAAGDLGDGLKSCLERGLVGLAGMSDGDVGRAAGGCFELVVGRGAEGFRGGVAGGIVEAEPGSVFVGCFGGAAAIPFAEGLAGNTVAATGAKGAVPRRGRLLGSE
jgi:hypothetical protein